MLYRALLLSHFLLVIGALAKDEDSPRIVIVGAGASGIAAATRLIERGFENVILLEAEDRIGGRIHTTELDEHLVDLGAQWIHGEKGNVAYELAAPLGLVAHTDIGMRYSDLYKSSGILIDPTISNETRSFYLAVLDVAPEVTNQYEGSLGAYFEQEFKEYFAEHPEVNETLQKQLLWHYNLLQNSLDPADSWYDISAKRYSDYHNCEGDHVVNWKERGYSTILDVLMKKIPDPKEELPLLNKTIFNAEVTKVDYTNEDGTVKITTLDGKEYVADHVIMTPSLGVLKEQYETLFDPPLPESKVNSIKGLGFGTVSKIWLAFNDSWWQHKTEEIGGFSFLWDDKDRAEYENNPETKWLISTAGFFFAEYRPRFLLGWVCGEGARLADSVPDDLLFNQTMIMLNKFLSEDYNISAPVAMKRSRWSANKHFRGTYSFTSMETERTNASAEILSQPIMKMGKPIILFAGEATNKHHFSTVHGAIESGWREADRLIDLYNISGNLDEWEGSEKP